MCKATLAIPALQVLQGTRVNVALPVALALKEQLAIQDLKVLLAMQGLKGHAASQVCRVQMATQGLMDRKALQVVPALKVVLVCKDL